MNVLLVDDEIIMLEELTTCIDWKNLGFSQVSVARSGKQALEIVQSQSIDLILCDIEMPQINGIELLSQIHQINPRIYCIIITCYPSFEYAQKALRIGCLDYLLKPIDSSILESSVQHVIKKIKTGNDKTNFLWKNLVDDAFRNVKSTIPVAQKYGIDVSDPNQFIPVIILKPEYKTEYEPKSVYNAFNKTNIENALQTIGEIHYLRLPSSTPGICIVSANCSSVSENEGLNQSTLEEEIKFLIGLPSNLDMLQASIIQLLELNKYYLFEPGYNYLDTILRAESNHFKVLKLNFNSIPATNDISLKSAYHYAKDVLSQPHELLQRENLISFRQMFEQSAIKNAIMFEYNESHFLEEEHFQRFRDISLFSTKNYLQYLESITEYLTKCRDARRSKYILVQRCTEYIDKHLQEDITRNSIARMAYLNVDYLDRCFRKEIGVTISQYILNSRMELACKLLMDCSMSIQTISTYVGYDSLSNFSLAFKRYTSVTPSQFRKDQINNDY